MVSDYFNYDIDSLDHVIPDLELDLMNFSRNLKEFREHVQNHQNVLRSSINVL